MFIVGEECDEAEGWGGVSMILDVITIAVNRCALYVKIKDSPK